jgi:hypothetical protein
MYQNTHQQPYLNTQKLLVSFQNATTYSKRIPSNSKGHVLPKDNNNKRVSSTSNQQPTKVKCICMWWSSFDTNSSSQQFSNHSGYRERQHQQLRHTSNKNMHWVAKLVYPYLFRHGINDLTWIACSRGRASPPRLRRGPRPGSRSQGPAVASTAAAQLETKTAIFSSHG